MARSDGPWREACLKRRGSACRCCGDTRDPQVDHVMPKSQGGASVVENGLVLCGPWTTRSVYPGGCHLAKTESRILIRPTWLEDDQIEWLAQQRWVEWDLDGEPFGRGWKHFERVEGSP